MQAHSSATRNTQTQHFSLKKKVKKNGGKGISNFLFRFSVVLGFWSVDFLFGQRHKMNLHIFRSVLNGSHSVGLCLLYNQPVYMSLYLAESWTDLNLISYVYQLCIVFDTAVFRMFQQGPLQVSRVEQCWLLSGCCSMRIVNMSAA